MGLPKALAQVKCLIPMEISMSALSTVACSVISVVLGECSCQGGL